MRLLHFNLTQFVDEPASRRGDAFRRLLSQSWSAEVHERTRRSERNAPLYAPEQEDGDGEECEDVDVPRGEDGHAEERKKKACAQDVDASACERASDWQDSLPHP